MTVTRYENGLPLPEYLQRQIPAAPPAYLKQLCRKGKVRSPSGPLAQEDRVKTGQQVLLPDSSRLHEFACQAPPLTILHETEGMLVVAKPAGLATHRTNLDEPDLTGLLQEFTARRGERYRVAPVTRLDRATSGLLVFAKGKSFAASLGQQVMEHSWRKIYLALVRGLPPAAGEIEEQLMAKGKLKSARTSFRCLHQARGHALLEVDLKTGRTHQIRRHCATNGFPIVGDRRYAPGGEDAPRLYLHSARLVLPGPDDSGPLSLAAALPPEFKEKLVDLWGKNCRDASEPL